MAEVGVLDLTIQDNSGSAAEGLGQLADALIKVREAVGTGLKLSGISRSINAFANSVGSNSKVLSSLGTFLNAITAYSKAFKETENLKFNKQPIEDLKAAIGDGIRIGQAGTQINKLREAFAGEWNVANAVTAGEALKAIGEGAKSVAGVSLASIATNITKVAAALDRYADAAGKVKESLGNKSTSSGMEAAQEVKGLVRKPEGGGYKLNLQMFAGKSEDTSDQFQQMKMDIDDLFETVTTRSRSITEAYENMANSVSRFSYDFASPMQFLPGALENMASQMQHSAEASKNMALASNMVAPRLQEISSEEMVVAGNARQATEAIERLIDRLNETQNGKGFADRFNWSLGIGRQTISAEESAVVFEAEAVRRFIDALLEVGETITSVVNPALEDTEWRIISIGDILKMFDYMPRNLMSGDSPLLLGDGTTPGQLLLGDGSEVQNMLSTWVDAGQQFMTDWAFWASDTAEQWRAAWSPDFILGGWNAPASMAHFALGSGMSSLLLGDGGVSPENMLSTWRDETEQWRPDWTDGSDWKPDWIYGDGTVDGVQTTTRVVDEMDSSMQDATETAHAFSEAMQEAGVSAGSGIDNFSEAARFAREWNASNPGAERAATDYRADTAWIDDLVNNASEIDLLNMKIESMTDRLYEGATAGNMTGEQIANLIGQIQAAKDKVEELTEASSGLTGAWNAMTGALSKMFPTLTGVVKQFGSIIRRRAITAIIRSVAKGFSEGVENMYHYSAAVNGSFAPAMDSAASALATMKNSIGAAVAPLITALVPALQTVISWVTTAINWLNQLFALLSGQSTWTKAVPETTKAFEKTKKAAGGASDAMKDLLADWDELNIIQSQNSGGGGGGGSGKTTADYSSMFEQVSDFSDSVKRVIDFIEDHLGGLEGLLKKLGAIILGWKFSKAFTGILGKLGKLLAGGALLSLGIELAYGGGFEAGKKGYFDTGDLIASIGGTLAAAVGGSLITSALGLGGGYGFAIGLTAGIFMTLVGWIKGRQDAADAVKWGNLHLTAEQIEEYVRKQFSFDVAAEVQVLHANIEFLETARQEVDDAITDFENKLRTVKANVKLKIGDDDYGTMYMDMLTSAKTAISKFEQLLDDTNTGIEVGMSVIPSRDDNGNDVSDDVLAGIKIAEQPIRDYLYKMGQELSDAMLAGEKAGWANGTDAAALALAEEQAEIFAKAKQYANEMQFESNVKGATDDVVKDGVFDRETALAALEYQKQQMEEFRSTALQEAEAEAANLRYLAGLAQAAAESEAAKGHVESASDLERSATELREKADQRIKAATEEVDRKLQETKETMAKDWAELIQAVYGMDVDQSVMESTFPNREGFWQDMFDWLTGPTDSAYKQGLRNADDKGAFIREWLEMEFSGFDFNGILPDITKQFGMNLWDILSEGARKNLFMNTADSLGGSSQARQAIMEAFGLTYDEIAPFVENYEAYIKGEAEKTATEVATAVQDVAKESQAYTIGTQETPLAFMNFGFGYKAPEGSIGGDITAHIEEVTVDNAEEVKEQITEQVVEQMDGVIKVNPDIELSTEAQNALTMITNAVNSGLGMEEVKEASAQAIEMFGFDAFQEALPYIQQVMDMYRQLQELQSQTTSPSGSIATPWKTTAMAGAGSVNYANASKTQEAVIVRTAEDDAQDVSNTQAGVQRGTAGLLEAINSLVTVAQAINRKEFTVNINPTASWGKFGAVANRAYSKVTGEIE